MRERYAHSLHQVCSIGEMSKLSKVSKQINIDSVSVVIIDESSEGQRIDNFLAKTLKGVPKSHLYRMVRRGEVRVNKKRVDVTYKLAIGESVRIPPVRHAMPPLSDASKSAAPAKLDKFIIYEDEAILVLDKPAGLAVHGGSGVSKGVIEQLRLERPHAKYLELVHRLDRETSGVLMIGKKRSALVALHEAMRRNQIDKRYLMLVKGHWVDQKKKVVLTLFKHLLESGERHVTVVSDRDKAKAQNLGQVSETIFHLKGHYGDYSLLEADLITGRTHQLRVQLAHLGFPILGDDKYGDFSLNKKLAKEGLKRMFLHSSQTLIRHPLKDEKLTLVAPLPEELQLFLTTQTR
jgi:23S rRNA pseudouridine955/2504/2580 synthase